MSKNNFEGGSAPPPYTMPDVQINNKDMLNPERYEPDIKSYKENNVFQAYDTEDKRLAHLEKLNTIERIKFDHKLYLIGFGGEGRPFLYLFFKRVDIDPKNIIIIDLRDVSKEAEYWSSLGATVISNTKITQDNYRTLLAGIERDDIIVDAAIEIDSIDLLKFCEEKGCDFVNSCIENWDFKDQTDAEKYSLMYKHKELEAVNAKYAGKQNTNFVISMGCNPGNVSIWVKIGLLKIAKEYNIDSKKYKSWAELSRALGVKTIHVSEKDTQIVNNPKRVNEYMNTWGGMGEAYFEEAMGCVEASWGTHEKLKFKEEEIVPEPDNYLIWKKKGGYVKAQSWVPQYGRFFGNIIRHDESYTIGRTLTVKDNSGKTIYKPSVYYVYNPTQEANASLEELKERNHKLQDHYRFMTDEIIDGRDILGLTYYLENGDVFWVGSMLTIHEARKIFPPEYHKFINATNTTVSAGILSAVLEIIRLDKKGKKLGLISPDDLPWYKIIYDQIGYLGDFVFMKTDFSNIISDNRFGRPYKLSKNWQFDEFLVDEDFTK